MTKIVWSRRANNDFDRIYRFWIDHNKSPNYSEKILDETLRMLDILRHQNKIGQKSKYKKIRRVLVLENFSISYLLTENEIKILSFFDNRQDPKRSI